MNILEREASKVVYTQTVSVSEDLHSAEKWGSLFINFLSHVSAVSKGRGSNPRQLSQNTFNACEI